MIISVVNNYYAYHYLSFYSNYYLKEIIWFLIGFLILFISSKININFLINNSLYLYILGIILLIITLIFGKNINGSTSWLNIFGFSFQASEYMKIFLILYLREITLKENISSFKYIIISLIIVLIPSILVFLEPDTGPIFIYLIIWLVFLFIKKVNKYYYIIFFCLLFTLSATFLILYYDYQDAFINLFGTDFFYRMDRITNFLNSSGYQINRALTSISNSGIAGIKEIVYFPESATDFAFTMLIANFGYIGLIIFLITYGYFLNTILTFKSDKLITLPCFYILLIQASINMLMNIGLFPIIGITLPLLSYGGSSIISYFILIVFLVNEKPFIYNKV